MVDLRIKRKHLALWHIDSMTPQKMWNENAHTIGNRTKNIILDTKRPGALCTYPPQAYRRTAEAGRCYACPRHQGGYRSLEEGTPGRMPRALRQGRRTGRGADAARADAG